MHGNIAKYAEYQYSTLTWHWDEGPIRVFEGAKSTFALCKAVSELHPV